MDRLANSDGLNLIKVNKDDLLEKLIANHKSHLEEYDEAVVGYKADIVRELTEALELAEAGLFDKNGLSFDKPRCHAKDYTTVIEMLQMSVDDEIYVTMSEFKQYVQDEWHWKDSFSLTNSKYIS